MKQNARALILSLILAGSLTTPALAGVDADAQALAEKCPQEYAAFDAEAWLSGGEEDEAVKARLVRHLESHRKLQKGE